MLVDGAYDTRDNFDMLKRRDIGTVIRMRKNADMKRAGGSAARRLAVQERNLLDEAYWRYAKGYGRRWAAEGAFSALKRMLGEALRKVAAYDRLLMA